MRNKISNRILFATFIFLISISAIFVILPHIELVGELLEAKEWTSGFPNVGMWLITLLSGLLSVKFHKPVLKHELYCRDQYFIDRTDEREILYSFLEADNCGAGSLFFVKSGLCRGKTILLQRFADEVNGIVKQGTLQKKHPKAKKYSAYYIAIHRPNEDILQEIGQELCGSDELWTRQKVVTFLKKASYRKRTLLLIDNIDRVQGYSATEMAYSLLCKNPRLKIILAITEEVTKEKPHTLAPPLFGEMHIRELAKAHKIDISPETEQEIVRLSNGIPSYVRMIFQTCLQRQPITLSNIEDIQKIVEMQLAQIKNDNKIAYYLACLKLCYDGNIPREELLSLAEASESQLDEIFDAALAHEVIVNSQPYVSMDEIVAQCCLKKIYRNNYLSKINEFYRLKAPDSDIALIAQFMLPDCTQGNVLKGILKGKYKEKKYLFFAKLGDLEQKGMLQTVQVESDLYNTFRYYYLSSLLQLGEYSQAISALRRYEDSELSLPTLRESRSIPGFEMQYLIIDLHHLSNQFTMALGEIEAILYQGNPIRQEHKHMLLYLKAHCLKHLGCQLQEADSILEQMENEVLSQPLLIKVLYSRLAIHLFSGSQKLDYEAIIRRLNRIVQNNTPEWSHTARHLAYYAWKKTGSAEDALKIVNRELETLEITRWRIIYDFYFEKAEWMRIQNAEKLAPVNEVSEILYFYEKAIAFADENQDINLACCAKLGKILALFPEKHCCLSWCEEQLQTVNSEFVKMDKAGLDINKAYAQYIKELLQEGHPSQDFILYCRKNEFYDLSQHMEHGKELKLTVM